MADGGEKPREAPQRDRVIESVLAANVSFWRDRDGTAYVTLPAADGIEPQRFRVKSPAFKLRVRQAYGDSNGRALPNGTRLPGSVSDTAMNEAIPSFEALALKGAVCDPAVRVCRWEGAVWLDLGGPDWSLVRVTGEGWQVMSGADVQLIRPDAMRPCPCPSTVTKPR